jgi:Domain of unknown function (DUF5655)
VPTSKPKTKAKSKPAPKAKAKATPKPARQPWTCPRCDRRFANKDQNHSCAPPVPVDVHFDGRPAWMRGAFDSIVRKLGKTIRVEGIATGIHLAARSTFAGITTAGKKMHVEFLLPDEIASPRIVKVERLGPARVAHHVDLIAGSGADAELVGWLKTSRDEHS